MSGISERSLDDVWTEAEASLQGSNGYIYIIQIGRKDLVNIALYTIEQFGIEQARDYKNPLAAIFELLAEHPVVGRDFGDLGIGWRRHPHQDHVAYYKQVSSGILVLRLLHSRQDPARHL